MQTSLYLGRVMKMSDFDKKTRFFIRKTNIRYVESYVHHKAS